jgi:hypothetical protein
MEGPKASPDLQLHSPELGEPDDQFEPKLAIRNRATMRQAPELQPRFGDWRLVGSPAIIQ